METSLIDKRLSIISTVLIVLFSSLILYSVSYGSNGSIQPIPDSEYLDLLDMVATATKANYENITTWQGELRIEEDNYYYDEKCDWLPIARNDPGASSNSIRRRVTALVEFAVDIPTDKLYTKLTPTVKYKAVDLDCDVVVDEKYSPIISIVTPQQYLSYQPEHTYAYRRDANAIIDGKLQGKAAFLMSPEKLKGEQWGHVRDPRRYFFRGNKTVWDYLYALRNTIIYQAYIPSGKAPSIEVTEEEANGETKYHITAGIHGGCIGCPDNENAFINIITTFDVSAGLNLISHKVTDKTGKTLQTLDITYEKISDVYIPKSVHLVTFSFPEQKKLFDSLITFTKSILNEPIPDGTFTYTNLGLENGVRLEDEIKNVEYIYYDGKLVPATGGQ